VGTRFFCGAKIYLNKTDIEYSIDLLAKTMQCPQKEWVDNQPTPTFDKEPKIISLKVMCFVFIPFNDLDNPGFI